MNGGVAGAACERFARKLSFAYAHARLENPLLPLPVDVCFFRRHSQEEMSGDEDLLSVYAV